MEPIAIVGAFIMTLSLLAYGIGSITLIRFKIIGSIALIFLTIGVIFDISAIVLMMIGAEGTPFTFHGFIGYIAFLIMLIDTIWVWVSYFKNGIDSTINNKLYTFAKYAYLCWIIAYLTGSLIVLWR